MKFLTERATYNINVNCYSEFLYCFLQRPQLVKGNMQLFSVDQQRSQALEAHAASFASFKVCFMHIKSLTMRVLFWY